MSFVSMHTGFPQSSQYQTCHTFIIGYIRSNLIPLLFRKQLQFIHPKTLQFLGKIIENYAYGSLIIPSRATKKLYPKQEFVFNYVILEHDAILTSQNQGIISIRCFDMMLLKNSVLHLNHKGYHGGLPERQGGSYMGSCTFMFSTDCTQTNVFNLKGNDGVFTASKQPNYGGGGGGILFGGGAGYGTKGQDADCRYGTESFQ